MIARGFRSVIWVGAVGGAALGCYMVSLRVATERADLARVEHRIVDTQRDIRSLQTELGTRGRLSQLEEWNSNVLALSAPSTSQFVRDAYSLAQLQTRQSNVADRSHEVRMAALETGAAQDEAAPERAPKTASKPAAPDETGSRTPVSAARVVRAIAPARAAPRGDGQPMVRRASFVEEDSASPMDAPVPAHAGTKKIAARAHAPAGRNTAAHDAAPRGAGAAR
jgi:hypothetical protein